MYSYMNIYIFNQFFHLFSIRFLPAKIYIALEFFLPFQIIISTYVNCCNWWQEMKWHVEKKILMQAEMIICYSDLGRLLRKLKLKENGYKKVIFKSVYSERLRCPLPSPLPIFNCVYNIFFYICILKSKWFCFSHQSDIIIEKINLRKNLPYLLWTIWM